MNTAGIRRYRRGEEPALFEVFYSAVHLVAVHEYSEEQIQAWAPRDLDPGKWSEKIQGIDPFVADRDGNILGYADLQVSGYIDHFYVSGHHPRQGIGSLLMRHILAEAASQGIGTLTSDVSRTAQRFFEKFGFAAVEYRHPVCRGVVVPNVFMRRELGVPEPSHASGRTKRTGDAAEVVPVAHADGTALRAMLQGYLAEIGAAPEYPYFDLYWSEGGRYPYWIKTSGQIVGFALIRRLAADIMEIAEFFVSVPWRRRGIGRAAARALFAAHPGSWLVRTLPMNSNSQAFWTKAVPSGAQQTSDGPRSVISFTTDMPQPRNG